MQSFTRKIKRGHLAPVFNSTFQTFDFYRKAKNSGRFLLIGRQPYGNTNSIGVGPGTHHDTVVKLQRNGRRAMRGLGGTGI